MLFNSVQFFVFFAVVYTAYRLLRQRGQNLLLLAAGYVFYGCWSVRFLFLLALSTGVDFCCGLMLGTGRVPARSRAAVSAFLLGAAFAFTTVHWDAVTLEPPSMGSSSTRAPAVKLAVDWARLVPDDVRGWRIVIGAALAVAVGNLLYFPVVAMPPERRRRVLIVLTVFVNLAFLGFFKYFNFFIDSADRLALALGFSPSALHLHVILPVGISFYTFQSMSYTIDVYRGRMEPIRRFRDYATFVSFFPPLVAGPIERASDLLPQLLRPRTITLDESTRGLYLILIGLFKKTAIADGLAGSVDSIFGATEGVSGLDVAGATLLFAAQIYCDFSGYTDIARGVTKLLGMDLMVNFNLPYFSRSPAEFWQRWHISLSSWLRDYLYIPLGGNRAGASRTYRNLLLTMLLGGLWHGAAWNFVLWGLYHGLILCAYRAFGQRRSVERTTVERAGASKLRSFAAWAFFFGLTCYGWLLFRANSLGQVVDFTTALATGFHNNSYHIHVPRLPALLGLPMLIGYEIAEYRAGTPRFYRAAPTPVRAAWYAALAYLILMGSSHEPVQFIYFQF